jgi:RimJ/RimL family protein N-acetyltransferase
METFVRSRPELKPETVVLNDGTPVLVRPLRPDDKALLSEGLSRLSAHSRYQRFGRAVRELSSAELSYLTEIDYENHMAWVAVEMGEERERVVGVARYIRLNSDPSGAEVAVTVADSHRRRGLGTLLLGKLAESARANDVERFKAFVYWDNAPVLKLVRDYGADIRFLGDGMIRVTGSVPEMHSDLPQSSW